MEPGVASETSLDEQWVKRYGKPRLEASRLIALELGTTKVARVRDILVSGRDQLAPPTFPEWTSPEHANVRGPGQYQYDEQQGTHYE